MSYTALNFATGEEVVFSNRICKQELAEMVAILKQKIKTTEEIVEIMEDFDEYTVDTSTMGDENYFDFFDRMEAEFYAKSWWNRKTVETLTEKQWEKMARIVIKRNREDEIWDFEFGDEIARLSEKD